MDRNLHSTLTTICDFLDGLISRDRLEDHLIQAWSRNDTWPPVALDALRFLGMNLTQTELHARLNRLVRTAMNGIQVHA